MANPQETLQPYVNDMIALTKHIHQAVERQLNDARVKQFPDAYPLINRLDGVLESHIKVLEAHGKAIGDSGSLLKDAVASVMGVAAGLYDKVRTETVSSMLRDDYTALSLAAMGHTMLHTTALGVRHQATADLALSHLTDLTPIIVEISEVIPLVVVQELQATGEINDPTVGRQAVQNTQKAWSREVVE